MQPINLTVDLTPKGPYGGAVVLIDALRSCTVAPILFERGLETLFLSPSLRASRKLAEARELLLLGERGGLPPEGFNYGNSPSEFLALDLRGRAAVMVSENLPKTLPLVADAKHVLLGALYNADAVVARLQALNIEEVALVCCGFGGSEDLDDTLTAGYLAARLEPRTQLKLSGAAHLAVGLLKAFPDPLEAFWTSQSGHYLRGLNLPDDIAVASLVSQSDKVPELEDRSVVEGAPLYRFGHLS